VEPLSRAISDPDPEVREAAIKALDQIGDPRCVGALVVALVDDRSTVRHSAQRALQSVDMNWERHPDAHTAAPHLRTALTNKEYWIRQAAAEALGRMGEVHSTELPPNAIAEPMFYQRQAAAEALSDLLLDFDWELRLAAAQALGRLGQPSAVDALRRSAQDPEPAVRLAASRAMETLLDHSTSELRMAASSQRDG
jgi:HEAT repeat protein